MASDFKEVKNHFIWVLLTFPNTFSKTNMYEFPFIFYFILSSLFIKLDLLQKLQNSTLLCVNI